MRRDSHTAMRSASLLVVVIGTAWGLQQACAQDYGTIYTCVDAKGHATYQNAPCPKTQRIDAVKPYIGAAGQDPRAAERLRATREEMDRRNRALHSGGGGVQPLVPDVFDPKRCRHAEERRLRVIRQVGPNLRRDTLVQLDREVELACRGAGQGYRLRP